MVTARVAVTDQPKGIQNVFAVITGTSTTVILAVTLNTATALVQNSDLLRPT